MGIYEKALTIQNQINTLKTNLGLSADTPLDEVVTTASSGGTPTPSDSGIYKVGTIAQRDALPAKEGDICYVGESSSEPFTKTTEANGLEFSPVVTLDSALEGYVYCSLSSEDSNQRVQIMIEPTMAYFDIMTEEDYYSTMYESEDGLTFTLKSGETFVSLSSPVKCQYEEDWNDIISKFITASSKSFEGLFEFKDNSWQYGFVNCSITPDQMFEPGSAYTNTGIINGVLRKDFWKEKQLYIQRDEPVVESYEPATWIVPSDDMSDSYIDSVNRKSHQIFTTTQDITKRTVANQLKATSLKFHPFVLITQDDRLLVRNLYDEYYNNGVAKPNNSSTSCGVIDGTKAYILYMQDESYLANNQKRFDCIDLLTEQITSLPVPNISSSGSTVGGLFGHNKNYFMAMFRHNNSERYLLLYDRNANTWKTNLITFDLEYGNAFIPILDTSKCIILDQTYYNNEYALSAIIVDFATGKVENTFTYTKSDLHPTSNYPSQIYTTFSQGMTYYIEDGILKTPNDWITIDLNNITYDSLKNSFSNLNGNTYKGVKCKDFLIDSWYNQRFIKGTRAFKLLHTQLGNGKAMHTYCITDELLYLFSNDGYIFTVDLNQDFILINNEGLVFEISDDGYPANIEEGTTLYIKNAWLKSDNTSNNNTNQSKTAADKIYVNTSQGWHLVKDNT